eukprot:scaffold8593_cov248-Pinguiococcus_pyrenoidosus.AAC.5
MAPGLGSSRDRTFAPPLRIPGSRCEASESPRGCPTRRRPRTSAEACAKRVAALQLGGTRGSRRLIDSPGERGDSC